MPPGASYIRSMTSLSRGSARASRKLSFGAILPLALFILATMAVAAIGSIATQSGQDWYDTLQKPAFNPPGWVFSPVWTTLYVAMAVAAWLVYREGGPGSPIALGAWVTQLGLNLGWSWAFFGAENAALGLAEILVLLAAILITAGLFYRVKRLAALLMVPNAAWVAFATLLNFEIWRLN